MESKSVSRRSFIGKTVMTAGLTVLGADSLFGKPNHQEVAQTRLPREVWIATVSQQGMSAENPEKMV